MVEIKLSVLAGSYEVCVDEPDIRLSGTITAPRGTSVRAERELHIILNKTVVSFWNWSERTKRIASDEIVRIYVNARDEIQLMPDWI